MTAYAHEGTPLTEREMDVLYLLADGQGNKYIAGALNIGTETVKSRVKIVLIKLGAKNRTHAVALAYHRGLLVVPRRPA